MPLQSVPVINIKPFIEGDAKQKREVAALMRAACEEIGFFSVAGHGVPEVLIEEARQLAFEFFAKSDEEKKKIERPPTKISRGYSWVGDRGLAYSLGAKTPPDLQESFGMGPVDGVPAHLKGTPFEAAFYFPNKWPEGMARFRVVYEEYYRQMERVATQIMRIFAIALDLPEKYFDNKVDHHTSTMRAVLYPALDAPAEPGQLRAGEHTDYGTVTILRGDDVPGSLQVRLLNGEWVDVHPEPETLVCNIGDLMMRWTNDRWLSNLHRVALPPPGTPGTERLTLVFFHNPNPDALIECIDPTAKAKYDAVEFGNYYLGKHMKAQHLTVSARSHELAKK